MSWLWLNYDNNAFWATGSIVNSTGVDSRGRSRRRLLGRAARSTFWDEVDAFRRRDRVSDCHRQVLSSNASPSEAEPPRGRIDGGWVAGIGRGS